MTHKEALDQYSEILVTCLPMKDAIFIGKLSTFNLLPGNTNDQIQALPTQADRTLYLLNHVIKPALAINDTTSFENLLSAMEQCDYNHVKSIAGMIKSQMSNIETGMYTHTHTHTYH